MENLKEQMYCTMCYNNFSLNSRKPKVLPCDHLVCEKCLKQVCKNVQRNFSCPECHANHPVSKYPDQEEIVVSLKEIQKKKEERKARNKNSSTQEQKMKEKSRNYDPVDYEMKEHNTTKEQDTVMKESSCALHGNAQDDEAFNEPDDVEELVVKEETRSYSATQVGNVKKATLRHSSSVPNMYSANGVKSMQKPACQASNEQKMCSTHKKRFIMICKDHNVLICHECWKTKHSHCSTNDFWDEVESRKQRLLDIIYREEATLKNYTDEVERAFDAYDFKSNKTLEDIRECKEMWMTEISNFFERVQSAIEKKLVQEREKKDNFDDNVNRLLERYTVCKEGTVPIGENDIHKIFELEKDTQDISKESDALRMKTSFFENRKFMPKQKGTLLADARRRVADEMGCLGVIRVDVIGAPTSDSNGPSTTGTFHSCQTLRCFLIIYFM